MWFHTGRFALPLTMHTALSRIARIARVGAPAVFAILALPFAARGWKLHPVPDGAYGRYAAGQILDRAAPLFRAVAPHASELYLSIRPGLREQARLHVWRVAGEDSHGRKVVSAYWDADTGEVWIVSLHPEPGFASSLPPLDRRQAVAEAWRWLCRMGIAARASHWRLAGPPERGSRLWSVCWHAAGAQDPAADGGHTVMIRLDNRTGGLAFAQSWRTRSP